jgi:hypothetical protein
MQQTLLPFTDHHGLDIFDCIALPILVALINHHRLQQTRYLECTSVCARKENSEQGTCNMDEAVHCTTNGQ